MIKKCIFSYPLVSVRQRGCIRKAGEDKSPRGQCPQENMSTVSSSAAGMHVPLMLAPHEIGGVRCGYSHSSDIKIQNQGISVDCWSQAIGHLFVWEMVILLGANMTGLRNT